ncbi:hypothetical protein [Coleofasciculus sp. FACHB-1120]|uniref:hypothetical protein n=1 Tax=Coleofasciculus sp. FACHB-1120 TaxID=2692783 RepID=UPI001689155E|nr:hypothetical protein [Coleofasciculus sp. FACHB-1120]
MRYFPQQTGYLPLEKERGGSDRILKFAQNLCQRTSSDAGSDRSFETCTLKAIAPTHSLYS